MNLVVETSPEGIVFVDAIKSHIAPDRSKLLEMLEAFESGKYCNVILSDIAEEESDSMERFYKKELNLPDQTQLRVISYDDHKFDLSEYRETLDWMVLELLIWSHPYIIFPSEVPMIREFLETPVGKEKEAFDKWQAYWEKVDFEERIQKHEMQFENNKSRITSHPLRN